MAGVLARPGKVAGVAEPRLWLKGVTEAEIVAQIRNPEYGVMPGWAECFGEPTIKQFAVYAHTLGGGQ